MTHQEIVGIVISGGLALMVITSYVVIWAIQRLPIETHDGERWVREKQ